MAVDVWGSRNEDVTLVNEFGLMDKYGTDYFNQAERTKFMTMLCY